MKNTTQNPRDKTAKDEHFMTPNSKTENITKFSSATLSFAELLKDN